MVARMSMSLRGCGREGNPGLTLHTCVKSVLDWNEVQSVRKPSRSTLSILCRRFVSSGSKDATMLASLPPAGWAPAPQGPRGFRPSSSP